MRYGSVCSGIEAASVAWESLGWQPAWFAEVEPFPSAVLAHHWPAVANLGDMTRIARRVMLGEVEAPDVLVGGTPCQAFSVAGMREGMADVRGQLTMKYVELADAIDAVRLRAGNPESIIVWENVPGVLSDRSNAFGCLLGALAGEDRELQPAGRRWTNAGCVYGPQRAVAWRVLDAQYFGVAQRRRRVFVVASARADIDPAAILLEREGLRRDSAPRREARQDAAADVAPSLVSSGRGVERTGETRGQDPVVAVAGTLTATYGEQAGRDLAEMPGGLQVQAFGQNRQAGPVETSHALSAHGGPHGRLDFESETFLVHAATGDITHTLNTANNGKGCSEDGTGRGVPTTAFSCKDDGRGCTEGLSPTLRAMAGSVANGGGQMAVCFVQNSRSEVRQVGGDGQITGSLTAEPGAQQQHYVAQSTADTLTSNWHESGGATAGNNPGLMNPVFHGLAVRRLTPVECERLQGFPDNHTQVTYRNKPAADGPRYKAIGNSMAVPVMQWIGRRIQMNTQEAA